jgi:hypothetical protein
MYMQKQEERVPVHADLGVRVVLLIAVLAIIWLGIGPSGVVPGIENVLEWARVSLATVASAGF